MLQPRRGQACTWLPVHHAPLPEVGGRGGLCPPPQIQCLQVSKLGEAGKAGGTQSLPCREQEPAEAALGSRVLKGSAWDPRKGTATRAEPCEPGVGACGHTCTLSQRLARGTGVFGGAPSDRWPKAAGGRWPCPHGSAQGFCALRGSPFLGLRGAGRSHAAILIPHGLRVPARLWGRRRAPGAASAAAVLRGPHGALGRRPLAIRLREARPGPHGHHGCHLSCVRRRSGLGPGRWRSGRAG